MKCLILTVHPVRRVRYKYDVDDVLAWRNLHFTITFLQHRGLLLNELGLLQAGFSVLRKHTLVKGPTWCVCTDCVSLQFFVFFTRFPRSVCSTATSGTKDID